jgi:hypothetical protein
MRLLTSWTASVGTTRSVALGVCGTAGSTAAGFGAFGTGVCDQGVAAEEFGLTLVENVDAPYTGGRDMWD